MTEQRLSVAHHEAGHVTAAWVLLGDAGIIGEVSIRADLGTDGHAEVGPVIEADELLEARRLTLLGDPVPALLRDKVECRVIVLMAGMVAELDLRERTHTPDPVPPVAGSPAAKAIERRVLAAMEAVVRGEEADAPGDLAHERELLAALTTSRDEADAYRTVIKHRTWHLVTRNRLFRPIADAVAARLLEHESLSRVELLRLIHASIGIPPPEESAVEPGERQHVIDQARSDLSALEQRAASVGWTLDLRQQYLAAINRLDRARDPWVESIPTEPTH